MGNVRTAIIFSLITQYSVQIIGFISIIVFARLLTPREIGIYAVAGSVAMLAMELRSLGVVQYLVREEHLTEHKIRTSLGMTVIVSWSLGALICVCAPMVAVFYEYPALKHLLWIMSFQFWMVPFTSVPIALLKRELEFQKLLVIWIAGAVVTFICTVILLLEGYSYYGLGLGVLVGGLSELAVAIYYQPRGTVWIPSFAWVGGLVRFGLLSSATNLFTKFSESIPDLVIGRMGTMANVGLFSRGMGAILFLNRIIVQAVSPVVLPHLANIKRDGGDLADAYLQAIKLQGAFSWPVFAVVNVSRLSDDSFLVWRSMECGGSCRISPGHLGHTHIDSLLCTLAAHRYRKRKTDVLCGSRQFYGAGYRHSNYRTYEPGDYCLGYGCVRNC